MSQIWTIFLIIFINMLGFGVIIPLAPTFQMTYNLTAFQYGVLGAIFPLSQMISAPILGRMSDRKGRRPIILVSFLFVSLSYLVLAFAPSYSWLVISRVLGGFFAGSFVVAFACGADISDKENRRKYMGIAGMGFGFGFMLGPAMGALFAGNDSAHANVFGTAIFAFSISIVGLLITIKYLPETLKNKYHSKTSIFRAIGGIFKKPEDFINFSLSTILSMVLAGLEVFLSLWIARKFFFTPFDIGIFWTLFAVMMNFGRVVLLKYIHGYKGIIIAFTIISLGTIGYSFTNTIAWVYIWTFVIGLFGGVLITLINSTISLNADPDQQGLFLGLNNAAGNVGRMLGPYMMGYIIQIANNNFNVSWLFLTFMCLIAVLGAFILLKKEQKLAKLA